MLYLKHLIHPRPSTIFSKILHASGDGINSKIVFKKAEDGLKKKRNIMEIDILYHAWEQNEDSTKNRQTKWDFIRDLRIILSD